jgi:hypothetical protein
MSLIRKPNVILLALLCVVFVQALSAQTATASPASTFTPKYPGIQADDLLPETQFGIHQQGYAGLIWWIPTEFWQVSSESHGRPMPADFKSLDNYTTVGIFFAKVGSLGNFDFAKADDLRKNLVVRDQDGNEYPPLQQVSSEATALTAVLKPMLAGAMGRMGESMEIFYFPAVGKNGKRIASATEKTNFKLVLRDTLGMKEHVTQVETPLTALSPAKSCPVDHRKMSASWSYCPWHGVALETEKSAAASASSPTK